MIQVCAVLFCIISSFFFSGVETGVLLLNRPRVRYLKERGSLGARILTKFFLPYPDRLSSTVLVGNTIVNSMGAILVARWFLERDGSYQAIGATLLYAFIIWFFGELLPKAVFRRFPTRLTTLLAPFLLLAFFSFWPLVQIFVALSQVIIRVMGGKVSAMQMFVTRDELKLIAHEGKESILMSGEQSNLISSILDHQKATAREVMRPRPQVVTVHESQTEEERLALSLDKGISRLPVETSDGGSWRTVWVAYDTLFGRPLKPRASTLIQESAPLDEVLRILSAARSPFAVVIDREGKALGILTVSDVLQRYFGKIDL